MAQEVRQEITEQLLAQLNYQLPAGVPRLALVDPRILKLAPKNARFMKPETFKALTENIRKDGNLSSVPFCFRDEKGALHVLSGNHRVAAAIEAGVPRILVFYAEGLSESKQLAIQLSHNAIEGEDDAQTLKELWDSIQDLESRIYAGLDSETLGKLEKIEFTAITEERLDFKSVSFLFLPEEVEKAREVFDRVEALYKDDESYIFSLAQWERFFCSHGKNQGDAEHQKHGRGLCLPARPGRAKNDRAFFRVDKNHAKKQNLPS